MWYVDRMQHEPGSAGDFTQSFLTPQSDLQFFFNTEQLRQFVSSADQDKNMYRDLHISRRSLCSLNNTCKWENCISNILKENVNKQVALRVIFALNSLDPWKHWGQYQDQSLTATFWQSYVTSHMTNSNIRRCPKGGRRLPTKTASQNTR